MISAAASQRAIGRAWVQTLTALVELSPGAELRLAQLRTSPRGVLWQAGWLGSRDGGPFETPFLFVCELDATGRLSRMDVWDVEMIAEARSRFDALSSPLAASLRPFANAATRASDLMTALWRSRDWTRLEQSWAPDYRMSDRRRKVQLELDGAQTLEFTRAIRAIGDMDAASIRTDVLATRGESLALTRWRMAASDGDVRQSEIDELMLVETNASGQTTRGVRWDGDVLALACVELDARYAAGEALGSAAPAAFLQAFIAALDQRDWKGLAACYAIGLIARDHRLVGWGSLNGRAAFLPALQERVTLAPDVSIRVDHVRATTAALVFEGAWVGTRDGGAFENPFIVIAEIDPDGTARCLDFYDPRRVETALGRFAQIGVVAAPSAMVWHEQVTRATAWHAVLMLRLNTWVDSHDWSPFRAFCSPDMLWEDRRALMQLSGGYELMVASLRERAATGARPERTRTLGIFGDRIVVFAVTWAGGPADGRFLMEYLVLIEIDVQDQLVCMLLFDADRAADAQREARTRWIAIEPAVDRSVELSAHMAEAFNTRDGEKWRALCADNVCVDDRRRTGFGRVDGADAFTASSQALWELSSNVRAETGWFWHAVGVHGCVTVVRRHGTSNLSLSDDRPITGGEFESEYLQLWVHANGRITHTEMFEMEDQALAIARYEAIARSLSSGSPDATR